MMLSRTAVVVSVIAAGMFVSLPSHVLADNAKPKKVWVERLDDEQLKALQGGTNCDNSVCPGGSKDDCNDQTATNNPVDVRNGNLFYNFLDFSYPTRGGGQIALSRHYNAQAFSELENWDPEPGTGTWVIQNGVYNGQGDRCTSKNTYTDAIVELDMRTIDPGANTWETAWVNFRYTDRHNRYYLLIHTTGVVELTKLVNGVATILVENGSGYVDPLAWSRVRIENTGTNIKVFINGAPVFDVNDSDLTQGQVALESYFSQCQFDHVAVTDTVTPANSTSDNFDVVDNDNPFGNQWTNNYSDRLWERSNGDVVIERGQGTRRVFVWNGATYDPPQSVNDTLVKNLGVDYVLTTKFGTVTTFATDGSLASMADRNGNTTTFGYTNVNATISPFVKADQAIIVDNFEDGLIHLNSLDRSTDDDGTLSSKSLVGGAIQLDWNNTSDYWYSTLEKDALHADLSNYTHLTVDLKGNSGGEDFKIQLQTDTGNATVQVSSYTALTTNLQTVQIPLTDFTGVDLTKAKAIRFNFDVQASGVIQADNLGFVANTAANPPVNYTVKRLTSITDSSSRITALTYGANGKVSQMTDPAGRIYTYTYDADGNQLTATDPRGSFQTFEYNSNRTLKKYTDYNSNSFDFVYAYNNRCVEATDPLGKITTLSYLWTFTELRNDDGDLWTYQVDPIAGELLCITDPLGHMQQWELDPNCGCGQAATTIDENGHAVLRTYDANNNVDTVTNELNQTVFYTYEPNYNLIATVTDQLGRVTTNAYDANGNLTSVTNALGHVTSFTYDADGNRLTSTDPLSHTTTFTYDTHGSLLTQIDPLSNTWTYTYNTVGQRLTQTDPKANTSTFVYDNAGFNTSVTDPLGNATTFEYDGNGNQTKITEPGTLFTQFAYDGVNNLASITDPLGNITQHVYNTKNYKKTGQSFLIQTTDANANVTTTIYDALGRVISTTDANGGVTSYTYDPVGLLMSVTDANGNTTTYGYTAIDQLRETTYPDGSRHCMAYDPVGNFICETTRKGDEIIYEYDAINRRTKKTYPDLVSIITYTYDAANRLTQVDDIVAAPGSTTYTYDNANRLLSVNNPWSKVVSYEYDQIGNRTKLTYPDTTSLTYQYDLNNRLTQIHDVADNEDYTFEYDTNNRRTKLTYGNGVTAEYTYDNAHRLTDLVNKYPNASVLSQFTYTHDAVGNRLTRDDHGEAGSENYTYDSINRVTQATHYLENITYTLDPVGNRTSINDNGSTTNYTVNNLNQYATVNGQAYTYDANGSLISKPPPGSAIKPQSGTAIVGSAGWTTVNLPNTYNSMVVVATPSYTAADPPGVIRIRNASGSSFEIKIDPVQTGQTLTNVTAYYMVAEEGVYNLQDHGVKMEAVKFTSTNTARKGSWVSQSVGYQQTYVSPVVVGQVMTANDPDWSVFWCRGGSVSSPPSSSTLYVGKHVGADPNKTRVDETLGFIVIESGSGSISGTPYEAKLGGDSIRGIDDSPPYTYNLNGTVATVNAGIAVINAMDGADGGFGVFYGASPVSSTQVQLAIDEDMLGDTERNHTTEQVAYLVLGVDTPASPTTYLYDIDNRLIQVDDTNSDQVTYVHDFAGRRIRRAVNGNVTDFVYDGAHVLMDLDASGNMIRKYILGPGIDEVLTMRSPGGGKHYFTRDGLNFVTNATTSSASRIETYTYDIYGAVSIYDHSSGIETTQSPIGNRYLYTGREWEPETGLYYYRARHYDPTLGRFLQPDPVNYIDGMNLYEYALSNPVLLFDPTGLTSSGQNSCFDCDGKPKQGLSIAKQCCNQAAPLSSSAPNPYPPDYYYRGVSARFMFDWGGDGAWGQSVRGCLVCMHTHGAPAGASHNYCYARASDGWPWWVTKGGIAAIKAAALFKIQ